MENALGKQVRKNIQKGKKLHEPQRIPNIKYSMKDQYITALHLPFTD